MIFVCKHIYVHAYRYISIFVCIHIYRCIQYPYFTLLILPFLFSCYCRNFLNQNLHLLGSSLVGGVQPHFCPWKNVCFPIFSPWGKKNMERERNECFSLSFHILFFHFPHGEKWENTHFSMGKNGVGPPPV